MAFAQPRFQKPRNILEPIKTSFFKVSTTTDINALKSLLESVYSVQVTVTGNEPNFTMEIVGPRRDFEKALREVFPTGRDDIIREKALNI